MDIEIREYADKLVEAIRDSNDYRRYRECEAALRAFPGIFDQIMELRRKTIELYHDPDHADLLTLTDELAKQYAELEKIPEVNAFLEAEEELVRILNDVSNSVVNSVELRIPNI